MLQHSLGNYFFHGMRGTIDLPSANIVVETRAGRNGVTLWNLGVWGKPFDLETTLFTANYGFAQLAFSNYKLATAMNPLLLTMGSVTVLGGLFQVLDVNAVRIDAIMHGHVAGDPNHYFGIVVARWTLFPIALSN